MLLWLVVAICFFVCVAGWHLAQGITAFEAAGLFIASAVAFSAQLTYLYNKNTTDQQMVSGFVTSMLHRSSYHYGKNDREIEPEHWVIEQSSHQPTRNVQMQRPYAGKRRELLTESCSGECLIPYPKGEPERKAWKVAIVNGTPAFLIDVAQQKLNRTKQGDPSAVVQNYYNPVMASDDVVYSDGQITTAVPYFGIADWNNGVRLVAPHYSVEQVLRLEKLNAALSTRSNISLGLVITPDPQYFENLKRAWHRGKANDFTVVVTTSADGNAIRNTDVLAWDNYNLQANVTQALAGVEKPDVDTILQQLETTMMQGPVFVPRDFEKLRFLSVKIPTTDYLFILSYQVILVLYLMMLLDGDPSTKTQKANIADILETWSKSGHPSSPAYYLHPFSASGLFILYTLIPFMGFWAWQGIFHGLVILWQAPWRGQGLI
jgi:hypothetical protein